QEVVGLPAVYRNVRPAHLRTQCAGNPPFEPHATVDRRDFRLMLGELRAGAEAISVDIREVAEVQQVVVNQASLCLIVELTVSQDVVRVIVADGRWNERGIGSRSEERRVGKEGSSWMWAWR